MIVTRHRGELVLVDQDDHGEVAGDLAAAWGNARFAAPERAASVVLAARRHDIGWRPSDARPLFDAAARRPLHFTDIDRGTHIPLYRAGVAEIERRDAYAGLLVSMHWIGLYRRRWAAPLEDAAPPAPDADAALVAHTVDEEERRWVELGRRAWDGGPRSAFETARWYAYELLQTWDLMALALSMLDLDAPRGGEPTPATAVIADIEPPAGPLLIGAVPTAPAGPTAELTLTVTAPRTVTVDPFPFGDDELITTLRARRIPDRPYATAADLTQAAARAPFERTTVQLHSRG